jgi:signal transduction histidine kinase
VEAIPLALLILDRELRVAKVSRRYCELFGVERDDAVGCSLYALGVGRWSTLTVRALLEAALRGETPERVSLECDFPSRGRRAATVHARPLATAPADAWILFVVEDTPAGPEASLDEFLGQLEHQLRGPLASIANWLHLLSTNPADAELQEQGLAAIGEAIKAQTRLLDDLRSAGKKY